MKILQRRLTPRIEHSLTTNRVTAVMGPRQAGKTTLVRHLLQSDKPLRYYNLKDPAVRLALKENSRQEFNHFRDATIILDEMQTMPELLEIIQVQVDETPEQKGRFLLLGSNHLLLDKHIRESLAGRVALFTLLPLSLTELLEQDKPTLLENLLGSETIRDSEAMLTDLYLTVREAVRAKELLQDLNRFGVYPEFIERKDPQDRMDRLEDF